MKKLFLFLAAFALNALNAHSQGYANDRVSVYLHPYSLFSSVAEGPVTIYSTVEIPLNLSYAFIIYPDVWFDRGSEEDRNKNTFRAGSGLGVRYFANERGEGLYLQAIASLHYYSIKYNVGGKFEKLDGKYEYIESGTKRKGTSVDLAFYLGSANKFRSISVFSDVGVGFGHAKHGQEFYYNNVVIDANLGIGLPF